MPDSETMAVNAFKAEGVLLFRAEQDANALTRRLGDGEYVTMRRDELGPMVERLGQAVAVAREYHIGAAEFTT